MSAEATKLIIDIGSNSIKFLTVKGKEILNKGKTDTGLYGIITSYSSAKHIIGRIMQIIEDDIKANQQFLPSEIFIYATETVRQFEHKEELIAAIKEKYNTDLRILSGKEEAEYSYKVATKKFPEEKDVVVVDLGGASTEVSMGLDGKYVCGVSLPIGAHNVGDIGTVRIFAPDLLGQIYKEVRKRKEEPIKKPLTFILMGGMVDCLNRIEAVYTDEEHEYIMLSSFEHFFATNKENLSEYRQKATANGITILDYVLNGLVPDRIYICREDLRFHFI